MSWNVAVTPLPVPIAWSSAVALTLGGQDFQSDQSLQRKPCSLPAPLLEEGDHGMQVVERLMP